MAVVALLGAMNVGGRRLTNDDLVTVFAKAGHSEVSAFQASGNVIMSAASSADEDEVSAMLEAALGYRVEVFVRTDEQIRTIASQSPLRNRTGPDGGKPQIVFLKPEDSFDHVAVFPDDHEVHHIGTEIHWLPSTGLSKIGPMKPAVAGTPGPTTVRTLGTIQRLTKRFL